MEKPCYTLADIAARFGGRVLGAADTAVSQIATLERAGHGQIAFLANAKYRKQLEDSQAAAVILGEADAGLTQRPRIVATNPYAYFARLSAFLNPLPEFVPGIISAATMTIQQRPIPSFRPVMISGIADGRITYRITCQWLAPSEYAAWICSCEALRMPERAASASGAKHAR